MYIDYMRNEHKSTNEKENSMIEVQKKYADVLLDCLTQENLELLSGLNIFPEDIWRNNFMPGIKQLSTNIKEALICQNSVQGNTMAVV
jgi:hypothetical protein